MAERKDIRDERREIRAEISRARARLGGTIDVITERFSAARLKEMAWDEVRAMTAPGSRARTTGTALAAAVRGNPIPAAMAGAGLIMLFARGGGHGRPGTAAAGGEAEEAAEKVREIGRKASRKAHGLKGRAGEKAGYAGERISLKAGQVKGALAELLENNPLAVAAAAFAVGSALGLVLPETQKEHEILGEAGGNLEDEAGKAA